MSFWFTEFVEYLVGAFAIIGSPPETIETRHFIPQDGQKSWFGFPAAMALRGPAGDCYKRF